MKERNNIVGFFVLLIFFGLVLWFSLNSVTGELRSRQNQYPEVHFFDVGQGDASLIELNSNVQILIDGGPDKTILEHLGREMPVDDYFIDYVILSHSHADHLNGLIYVAEKYDIGRVFMGEFVNKGSGIEYFLDLINERETTLSTVELGDFLNLSGAEIYFIWSERDRGKLKDLNDTSLVFTMTINNIDIFYTGDVSWGILETNLDELGPVDILKVSHHGSKTGTSQKLIEVLKPTVSIISVGKNRYGHPHREVLGMLYDTILFRTDVDGNLSFLATSDGLKIKR